MKKNKSAYLVGIKGVAMTALAVYLKQAGYRVLGSDVAEIFPTDKILKDMGIMILRGFHPGNISENFDLVIATGAHGGMTNVEVQEAVRKNLKVYMHGKYLGQLMENKFGISVAGCHGKTTTSSLIATILARAKYNPSYLIGTAEINQIGPAGHFGRGKYFIAEADEYMTCPLTDITPRFLWQKPQVMIITNIEFDHPDAYKDIKDVKSAYLNFTRNLASDGVIIACKDSEHLGSILPLIDKQVITYGFSPSADYIITKIYYGDGVSFMKIRNNSMDLGEFMYKIPGRHGALDVLAASIACQQIGLTWEKIRQFIKTYTGCKRRFEKIKDVKSLSLYDDYAHHPSEIKATIEATKKWFPDRRLIVIFQPHTYSRTKALLAEFSKSFEGCGLTLIADIFPSARESFDPSITSRILVNKINITKNNAVYCKNKYFVLDELKTNLKTNDLILTMGAGDIYLWHNDIVKLMKSVNI